MSVSDKRSRIYSIITAVSLFAFVYAILFEDFHFLIGKFSYFYAFEINHWLHLLGAFILLVMSILFLIGKKNKILPLLSCLYTLIPLICTIFVFIFSSKNGRHYIISNAIDLYVTLTRAIEYLLQPRVFLLTNSNLNFASASGLASLLLCSLTFILFTLLVAFVCIPKWRGKSNFVNLFWIFPALCHLAQIIILSFGKYVFIKPLAFSDCLADIFLTVALVSAGLWCKTQALTPLKVTRTHASSLLSGADRLRACKEMLDAGVISQEEFDAKKKEILEGKQL